MPSKRCLVASVTSDLLLPWVNCLLRTKSRRPAIPASAAADRTHIFLLATERLLGWVYPLRIPLGLFLHLLCVALVAQL
jgi:hypothetical protein